MQAALVGSVIANGVLVLGLAFLVGGIRNGPQQFESSRARMIATLAALASVILSVPTLAHAFHSPAAQHGRTLSLICAGVLIVLFFATLPAFLRGGRRAEPRAAALVAPADRSRARRRRRWRRRSRATGSSPR